MDEDQCWTLARVTEVIRRRFTVDYTLAGADLPDRVERAGPGPAGAARDEARIATWREETWPVVKGRRRTWAPG